MQTKKRVTGKGSSRELASPRVSRHQKKHSENVQVQEMKVAELITSSARKQKCAGKETNLNSSFRLVDDDPSVVCLEQCVVDHTTEKNNSMDIKGCDEVSEDRGMDTIFSPTFHNPRTVGDQISNEGGDGLSTEVSAIYQSMKNSKLECVDEYEQEQMSNDAFSEEDESDEFDEFDPYFFIKSLPELSSVVPTFRPVLLPRRTRSCPSTTLVLDLDETLVHSTLEPCEDADFTFSVDFNLSEHTVFVRCRPYLKDFMERLSGLFEIIIFTASQSIYAEQLLNILDPKRKVFRHRVYRESCLYFEGIYLKDLSVLGRDLARVVIIDNSPQAFGFQVDNGIPIESWFDDRSDTELLTLIPFLESLVGVDDVRPLIAKKFNLRQRIAAAVSPFNHSQRSNLFLA